MTSEVEQIAEIWQLLRDYIPVKDRSEAAEHLISMLEESGTDERAFSNLANLDHELADAIDNMHGDDADFEDIDEGYDIEDVDY